MGIGEPHCDCLALVMFDLAVGRRLHLGDALPWRRLFLTTLALGVSSPRQRFVLTLTPGVDFNLDLFNARIRDGTASIRVALWSSLAYKRRSLHLVFSSLL